MDTVKGSKVIAPGEFAAEGADQDLVEYTVEVVNPETGEIENVTRKRKKRRTAQEVADAKVEELRLLRDAQALKLRQAEARAADAAARAAAAEKLIWKREDDRIKVLVGACVGAAMQAGQPINWASPGAVLDELHHFLVRPQERIAVLGKTGAGSPAFWRVFKTE